MNCAHGKPIDECPCERTSENPVIAMGGKASGWKYISPCHTSSVEEFEMPDGSFMCIGSVAGHGYGRPWVGRVKDINEGGYVCSPDGKSKRIYFDPSKESA